MILVKFTSGAVLNLEHLEMVIPQPDKFPDKSWGIILNSGEKLMFANGTLDYQDRDRLLKEWEEAADYIDGIE